MNKSVPTEEEGLKYAYMLKKLYATFDKYRESFAELGSLREDVERVVACQHPVVSDLHKLEDIEFLLKDRSSASYLIRHIHHNFCTEVVLFKSSVHLNDDCPYYIQIP